MGNSFSDYPDVDEEISQIAPEDVLLVEYEQAGEEWRNYEKLLHQSYYLSAIVLTFFLGAFVNLLIQDSHSLIIGLLFSASIILLILSHAQRAYHKRRNLASRLRMRIAEQLHELTNTETPRIQRVIVGGGKVKIQEKNSPDGFWERYPVWKITLFAAVLFAFFSIGTLMKWIIFS